MCFTTNYCLDRQCISMSSNICPDFIPHTLFKPVFAMLLSMHFSFWYHIYDAASSSSSLSLEVKMVRGSSQKTLLEISGSMTDGWENATAFIGNQPEGYKVSKRNTMHALLCRQICSCNTKLFHYSSKQTKKHHKQKTLTAFT